MTLDDLIARLTELRDDALGMPSADVEIELPIDWESDRAAVSAVTVDVSSAGRVIVLRGAELL